MTDDLTPEELEQLEDSMIREAGGAAGCVSVEGETDVLESLARKGLMKLEVPASGSRFYSLTEEGRSVVAGSGTWRTGKKEPGT